MAESWERSSNEVLAAAQDVVAIESINPSFPGGKRGECEMAVYLADFFSAAGIEFYTDEIVSGRSNIVATLPGKNPDRNLLFECHTDTVAVEGMSIPPFTPHIRDGKLFGRGSCDTKAGGVAMMFAMKRIKDAGLTPPCSILYVGAIDEELHYRGSLKAAKELRGEAVVVAEPTGLEIVCAHKGVCRFHVTVHGVAAHSSKPELGVSAISKMIPIVQAIEERGKSYSGRVHPLVGPPTVSIGVIEGGTQVNLVPESCRITVDRRVIPGETPEGVLEEFENLLEELQSKDADLQLSIETLSLSGAMETEANAAIVQAAQRATKSVLHADALIGVPYGSDASRFQAAGFPAIVLGPGNIDQAHTADEWIDCDQVLQAVDVYEQIMLGFE